MTTKRVLIVEDEATIQSILSAFFRRFARDRGWDAEIKAYADPVQGLFELTTNGESYDAVLLDIRMPKLTGDEIYDSLTHVNPQVLDRVLFVTGYPEDLRERFPDEQLNVLAKPFRYETFVERLGAIFD